MPNASNVPFSWIYTTNTGNTSQAGTADYPYRISTPEVLARLSYDIYTGVSALSGKYFKLTADLDMGQYEWYPIGDSSHQANIYFDGNGHTISGLYVNSTSDYVGLFGYANSDITNLTIKNSHIRGSKYVGGIVGYAYTSCKISNSRLENVKIAGSNDVGGFVGRLSSNISPAISGCQFFGTVDGSASVGGGVGGYSSGYSGGYLDCVISSCKVNATVSGTSNVGGIVGGSEYVGYYSLLKMSDCIMSGVVKASGGYAGAFVGGGSSGAPSGKTPSVTNCAAYDTMVISSSKGGLFIGNDKYIACSNCCFTGGGTQGLTVSNATSSYWQYNGTKKFTSESDDFSGFSVVPNMNGDLPIQNSLYSVAVGSTSEEVIAALKAKGFTAV